MSMENREKIAEMERAEAERLGMDVASYHKMQEAMRRKKAEEEAKKITFKKVLNVFFLGGFLFLVCAFAAMIMCFANGATRIPREKAKKEKLAAALRDILPAFDNDIIATEKSITPGKGKYSALIYTAEKNGKKVAYAVGVSTAEGYGGKMEALVSFSPEGRIFSFIITEHSETPGLGSEVAERKEKKTFRTFFAKKEKKAFPYNLPPGAVLDQFRDRRIEHAPWRLRSMGGNIDGRSGATITSHAVTILASRAALALKEMLKKEKNNELQ